MSSTISPFGMGSPSSGMVAFSVLVSMLAVNVATADFDMVLIHTNDMHSRFDETDMYCNECREDDSIRGLCYGGFARIAHAVKTERRLASEQGLPSLFMVAGDTFQGTPYFSYFKWRPVVDFVKELQPDIMTLGNHEFDCGVDSLVSYLNGIKGIPTVVCNLNTTMEPTLDEHLLSSKVFTFNNTKVGVVGYLTTDTPSISNTGNVKFYDEIESLKKETKKLRENGVNIIIGLGHSGIKVDEVIAREVEDLDLIVGGHSHTLLWTGPQPSIEKPYGPYPLYVKNAKNKSVPIVQVYANTKYVGKIQLRFDSNGNLVTFNGSPMLLNKDIGQDSSMLSVVHQWKPKVIEITNTTIGYTVVKLLNRCHLMECNIGNLITDSYVYYNILMNNIKDENRWTDAPIALLQSGGIRSSIDESDHDGLITLGQMINVMPFMNKLVKITISGSNLLEAFEHSVSDYNLLYGGTKLLQVSGVLVKFDLSRNVGSRVISLYLRCSDCKIPKYEPLVLTNNYTIVMNDYLANGGDNYKSFQQNMATLQLLEVEDINATSTYMNHISPIINGIEGRLTFENEKSNASAMNKWNCQLLLIAFSVLFFKLQNLI